MVKSTYQTTHYFTIQFYKVAALEQKPSVQKPSSKHCLEKKVVKIYFYDSITVFRIYTWKLPCYYQVIIQIFYLFQLFEV